MKKSILLSLALLASIGLSAAPTTEGDTIVVEKPQRVTVVTTDSIQHILVEGKEDNPHYTYSNTLQIVDSNYVSGSSINKDDFTIGFGWPKLARKNTDHQSTYVLAAHFCIGFVNAPGMPKAGDLNMGNSAELWFFFENEWRPWRNNHVFSFGIGLDWRNYRMEDNYCFRKDAEGMNVLERLPEGASPNFSRVKVFSLNFPIRYQYQGRRFGFSLGPVLNFNTYSSIKTKYKLVATNTRRSTRTHTPRPSPSTSWERSPRRSSTSTSSTVRSTFSSPTTDSSSRPSPSAACSKQKTGRWSMELETIHCSQGLS